MFNNIFNRKKNLETDREKAKSKAGAFTAGLIAKSSNTVKPYSKQDVVNLYSNTAYLKLCVDKIAKSCAQSKIRLYSKDGKAVLRHDILTLLKEPNPLMTQFEFISALIGALELQGEAYIFVEKVKNKPLFLYALTNKEVVEKPSQQNKYKYKIQISGRLYTVDIDDMIYLKDWDFSNLYSSGVSVAQSVADNVQTNKEITKYLQSYFNNNCEPSGIMSLDDTDEDELLEFKTNYEAENLGVFNRFKTFFVNKKFTYTKLSNNLEELGVVELQQYEQEVIRLAFSIPKELIGDNSSNRAGALVAKDLFISEVLQPKMIQLIEVLNNKLVKKYYNKDLYLEAQIESDSQKELAIKLMTACPSAFTKNEIRELAGYDSRADLEVYADEVKNTEQGVNKGYEYELTSQSDRADRTKDYSGN